MSIQDLQRQIDALTCRVRALEFEVRPAPASSAASASGEGSTFEIVDTPAEQGQNHGGLSWDRRLEIARETGDFFVRCLEGRDRKTSGQPQVGLPKRVYVLVRDYKGNVFRHPVQVYNRFSDLRPRIQEGSGFGNAIFAGFASIKEAREAVARASLSWPDSTSARALDWRMAAPEWAMPRWMEKPWR